MANFYGATGLTGGASGDLDKIDGAGLANADGALVITGSSGYLYYLNATSGAVESSPDVISPDSNAGTKRWILVSVVSVSAVIASLTINGIAQITAASNVDIDTGTETVDSFADTLGDVCFWLCKVKKGANVRASTVMAAWDVTGNTVEYTETSTLDVGDTSGLTFAVDISSDTVRLRATAGADDWTVKVQRTIL